MKEVAGLVDAPSRRRGQFCSLRMQTANEMLRYKETFIALLLNAATLYSGRCIPLLYSHVLFPFISVLLASVRLILQSYMGGSSLGKHECETTGFGEGERK